MSYYIDKYLRFKKEATWGEAWSTPDTFPNFLLDYDFEATESQIKEFVIAAGRDKRSRAWVQEEVTGRMELQMLSGKWFEYVLGSISATVGSETSWTIGVSSTIPSIKVGTCIYPAETGSLRTGYMGLKVDTAELTLEEGEDITLVLNWAGKGQQVDATIGAAPSVDFTQNPLTFIHGSINVGGTMMTRISRCVLTINNNLTAEYSCGAQTIHAVGIREGGLEIGMRLTVSRELKDLQTWAGGRTGVTVALNLINTGRTITFTMPNCAFDNVPNTARGIDPIDLEYELTAFPTTAGGDAIEIVEQGSIAFTVTPY